jgi:hypothetical protein
VRSHIWSWLWLENRKKDQSAGAYLSFLFCLESQPASPLFFVEQQDCGALPDLGGFVLFCSNLDLLQGIPATGVTLWSEGFGAEREGALLDCNRKCTDPARYPYDPAPRQMTHNDPSRAAGEVSSRASWVKCLLSKSAATGEYSAIQRLLVLRQQLGFQALYSELDACHLWHRHLCQWRVSKVETLVRWQ